MSIDDADKFKQKEMKQMKLINNTWYDWLINYISEPIRKSVGAFKTVYGTGKKLTKPKTQNKIRNPFILKKKWKKIKGKIIRNIWTIFEKEEKKKVRN